MNRRRVQAHFSIFILLSALILYSDWRVIVMGGGVIALHHALFTWLQHLGYVDLYSSMMGMGDDVHGIAELLACLLMHGGAVVQVVILGYLAKVLARMVSEGLHVTRFAHEAGSGKLDMAFSASEQRLPAVAAVAMMRDMMQPLNDQASQFAEMLVEIDNALDLSREAVDEAHQVAKQLSVTAETLVRAVSGFTLPSGSSPNRLLLPS
ncbi:hypothetical protein QC823_06120 [Halomonas vilamensis]|uniref:Uncharacterized protein n=1 Tax=Vreelandella vilamensis TaxID=531309 RepID=A0ABU1H488_9GAMM|nr:hypothetical protein [Halomonas vilamensis]MDR5898562.1 hypothetical protein [Halomonas vilamensis]